MTTIAEKSDQRGYVGNNGKLRKVHKMKKWQSINERINIVSTWPCSFMFENYSFEIHNGYL